LVEEAKEWRPILAIGVQRLLRGWKSTLPLTSDQRGVRLASADSYGKVLTQQVNLPWRVNSLATTVDHCYLMQTVSMLEWLNEHCDQAWAYRMESRRNTALDPSEWCMQIRHVIRMETRDKAMIFKLSCLY
jgi:hypothetical protein